MSATNRDDRKRFGRAYGLSLLIHAIFLWMLFAWFVASIEFGPEEQRERTTRTATTAITIEAQHRLVPTPRPHPRASAAPAPQPVATLAVTFPPTYRPTARPTAAPSPVQTPSPRAVAVRTLAPSAAPSPMPTVARTARPTVAPTATPTIAPTATPTVAPTATPTIAPTAVAPTAVATVAAAPKGTEVPTRAPATRPTAAPTIAPTRAPTAVPTIASPARPSAGTSDLEARMRRMLASINDPRHYDVKSYAAEIAEAEKRLASDYEVLHLKPPPLKGIAASTKAYEFDLGQVLYALKTIKVGPWEICAGWLVTTRGQEQPPAFYVGPCKKSQTIADPRDRPRQPGFPTPPPLHN